jgi:hypothetical protein
MSVAMCSSESSSSSSSSLTPPECQPTSSGSVPEQHISIDFSHYARLYALSVLIWQELPEVSSHILPQHIWNSLHEIKEKRTLVTVDAINGGTGEMFISVNEVYDNLIYHLVLWGGTALRTPSEELSSTARLDFLDIKGNREKRRDWWSQVPLFGKQVEQYLREGTSLLENRVLRVVQLPKELLETKYFQECVMQQGQPQSSGIEVFFDILIDIIQPTNFKDFYRLGSLHENFQTGHFQFANAFINNSSTPYQSVLDAVLADCKETWMRSQK